MKNSKSLKKKNPAVPLAKCSECRLEKPAFGFTLLSSDTGAAGRELCSACFNSFCAERGGISYFETPDFPPLQVIDSFGKEHTFFFEVRLSTGLGIQAFELFDGLPGGYQFAIMDHPLADPSELYEELIEKVTDGLAVHYIESSDFGAAHDRLYIHGSAINGRIEENNSVPSVVVDGREYSWEQFGTFLASHTGFNFRIECFDPYDTIGIDPNPKRPDPVWWLDRDETVAAGPTPRRFQ